MKNKHTELLLFISPIILAFLFKVTFKPFRIEIIFSLFFQAFFYVLWCSMLFSKIIKRNSTKEIILYAAIVISWFSLFLDSVYYYVYGASVGPSTFYFILQTNSDESLEFLKNIMDAKLLIFSVLFILSSTLSINIGRKLLVKWSKIKFRSDKLFISGYIIYLLLFLLSFRTEIIKYNLPCLAVKSVAEHHIFTQNSDYQNFENKNGFFRNVIHKQIADQETYVVIIGESTTKNRMALYGYEKNTNPKLNEIKDELFVFKEVISPYIGTIVSLGQVLTTSTIENSHLKIKNFEDLLEGKGYKKMVNEVGSIVQLFHQAGFKTFWLSNQRPIGIHENLVTKIATAADVQKFINVADHTETTPYDYELLPDYMEALKDPAQKKIIFMHLLGTHNSYEDRYPKNFEYFKKNTDDSFFWEEWFSNEKKNKVSGISYDNAVRYNDFFVREVIEKLRNTSTVSYLLYLSDHGEDLNSKGQELNPGRNPDKMTASMFEIPFIVWLSPKYKQKNDTLFNLSNKYITDDFIHSISNLSGITYDGFKPDRSIFNKHFEHKKRILMFGEDFDVYFDHSK